MAEPTTIPERYLNREQLAELLSLVRSVDSVELKISVPMSEHRATIQGLAIDPVESEPRQVFFFDTPDLALNKAGVVVRARRVPGGFGDTVVKLRPVVPDELPADIRRSGSFKVEVDVVPGGYVCSGSMKGKATGDEIRDVAAGSMRLSKVLTKEQRAFYRAHAPKDLTLDSLAVLGPTFALKSAFTPKALNRKVIAEMWLYPDGTRLLELSTKSAPLEGTVVSAEFRAYLGKRGIRLSGEQQTKTRVALEFYSAQIRALSETRPAQETAAAGG